MRPYLLICHDASHIDHLGFSFPDGYYYMHYYLLLQYCLTTWFKSCL